MIPHCLKNVNGWSENKFKLSVHLKVLAQTFGSIRSERKHLSERVNVSILEEFIWGLDLKSSPKESDIDSMPTRD